MGWSPRGVPVASVLVLLLPLLAPSTQAGGPVEVALGGPVLASLGSTVTYSGVVRDATLGRGAPFQRVEFVVDGAFRSAVLSNLQGAYATVQRWDAVGAHTARAFVLRGTPLEGASPELAVNVVVPDLLTTRVDGLVFVFPEPPTGTLGLWVDVGGRLTWGGAGVSGALVTGGVTFAACGPGQTCTPQMRPFSATTAGDGGYAARVMGFTFSEAPACSATLTTTVESRHTSWTTTLLASDSDSRCGPPGP